jgi:hypothetical protein
MLRITGQSMILPVLSTVFLMNFIRRLRRNMNKPDENIGLLIPDPDKSIHNAISGLPRQPVRDHMHRTGYHMVQAFATNDQRMLVALKLCGYETITRTVVQGIERFCKL